VNSGAPEELPVLTPQIIEIRELFSEKTSSQAKREIKGWS
jgi:hypothetical protein